MRGNIGADTTVWRFLPHSSRYGTSAYDVVGSTGETLRIKRKRKVGRDILAVLLSLLAGFLALLVVLTGLVYFDLSGNRSLWGLLGLIPILVASLYVYHLLAVQPSIVASNGLRGHVRFELVPTEQRWLGGRRFSLKDSGGTEIALLCSDQVLSHNRQWVCLGPAGEELCSTVRVTAGHGWFRRAWAFLSPSDVAQYELRKGQIAVGEHDCYQKTLVVYDPAALRQECAIAVGVLLDCPAWA